MTTRTTPDPRTEAAWLAGLPIPALRSLREVVAENIADAERLAKLGEPTDDDDVAGEVTCLAVIDAEIASRTARIVAEDRAESDDCQRLTPGCSIDHTAEAQRDRTADSPCETW